MISFHELYDLHARDVYRFALFLTGNPSTAQDLTSDTFVRAWTARGSIREATVRAYLLTVTRNLWRDQQRRDRRLVPLAEARAAETKSSPDAVAELGWTERRLDRIAGADRAALLLHARDGLSYHEVARVLRISTGAVKSRIFRARQALASFRRGDNR